MKAVKSVEELREALASLRNRSIGFVPTMGALHEGHGKLLQRAREANDTTVLSIYVNPTQFGPQEDLARYPRTLEADLKIARERGVDIVFFPSNEVMYPWGFQTFVEVPLVSEPWCGRFRPGHFRGVATVVTKLFQMVQPTRAYFGQKDLQQCLVIERLVRDLDFPISIITVPTVREADGLAMSSRNRYLDLEQRAKAPLIYRALRGAQDLWMNGEKDPRVLERAAIEKLGPAFELQYLEVRSYPDLLPLQKIEGPTAIAVAAYLGGTRLIDNIVLA